MNENINIVVSIIIPTKGRIGFLERALDSIVTQAYEGIQICIMDNNPAGETQNAVQRIVAHYEANHPAFFWSYAISRKENAAGVRNEGILAAKGKFICFLDDDDEFLPGSIGVRMRKMLADPGLALLYCASYTKVAGYPFRMYRYYAYQEWRNLNRIEAMSCAMIFNKEVLLSHQLFFDEKLARRHDYDFCRRILETKLTINSIPDPLVLVNLHNEQRISTLPMDTDVVWERLIKKWGPAGKVDVYNYIKKVIIWRKYFAIENKGYRETIKDLSENFNGPISVSFKLQLALVSLSPFIYMSFYHIGIMASQFYANSIVSILKKRN